MSDTTPVSPATPREAFGLLTSGNLRFAAGTPRHSRELSDRAASGHTAVVGLTYRLAEGNVRTVAARGLDLPSAPAAPSATAPTPDSR